MKLKKTCEFCNKEFEVNLSKNRFSFGNRGRFCNKKCYWDWLKEQKKKTEKKCSICKQTKSLLEFYTHNIHGYRSECKICAVDAANKYYHDNKEIKKEHFRRIKRKSMRRRRNRWRNVVIEKFGLTCPDCGYKGPYVTFDFHHLDPSIKEINLGYLMVQALTKERLKELDKGILLCSNCHRIRHWGGK